MKSTIAIAIAIAAVVISIGNIALSFRTASYVRKETDRLSEILIYNDRKLEAAIMEVAKTQHFEIEFTPQQGAQIQ